MRVPARATWAMVRWVPSSEVDEATPGPEYPAVVPLDGSDRPDRSRQLVDPDALDQAALAEQAPGDPSGQNVDCQQLAAAGVPPNALTELGLLGIAGDCLAVSLGTVAMSAFEVDDDLDVVWPALEGVGDVLGRDPARDQPGQPGPVGPGQLLGGPVEVPPVGVD